ncbi:hypothetical protein [uncultured Cytophaga sp.]|uniref:hypothetical protein n=1 Tax=uncultured Cytophaga sp. TaxID=160238 RepID=UPI00262E9042|nr:hypothetical protein [uncultured Cytophaga sp.]
MEFLLCGVFGLYCISHFILGYLGFKNLRGYIPRPSGRLSHKKLIEAYNLAKTEEAKQRISVVTKYYLFHVKLLYIFFAIVGVQIIIWIAGGK